MHVSTFDAVEYRPAAHCVHVTAPVLAPVFVIEPAPQVMQSVSALEPVADTYLPAPQSVHDPTFDAVEYLPASHSVHAVAPAAVPVFVFEPAAQAIHADSPSVTAY